MHLVDIFKFMHIFDRRFLKTKFIRLLHFIYKLFISNLCDDFLNVLQSKIHKSNNFSKKELCFPFNFRKETLQIMGWLKGILLSYPDYINPDYMLHKRINTTPEQTKNVNKKMLNSLFVVNISKHIFYLFKKKIYDTESGSLFTSFLRNWVIISSIYTILIIWNWNL